jgi:hypothetical protein
MLRLSKVSLALTTLLSLVLTAGPTARAANFSFTGLFTQDDDVQLFTFTVDTIALETVTLLTLSYAGGVGVAPGGFDPVLSLFDPSGVLMNNDDDSSTALDAATGLSLDARLQIALPAGTYRASLTQSPNFATGPNLSDGFQLAGTGNFAGGFVDISGNQRDGHWAVDILNVQTAAVVGSAIPEPATLLLLSVGLAGLVVSTRAPERPTFYIGGPGDTSGFLHALTGPTS